MNTNGEVWFDDQNNQIQAHGGMILKFENLYYWYGENKDSDNYKSSSGGNRVSFIGISCYSSSDLRNWHNEGLALTESGDGTNTLNRSSVVERPKVVFNIKTNKFVMWCHYDTEDYHYAGCCIATADKPTGPFTVVRIIKPNLQDCRDMTLFVDQGAAYLIYSSDGNKTLRSTRLSPDYTDVTQDSHKLFIDQEREAPTIFYYHDWYFMITSGCTGWKPNPALYSRSHFLASGQKLIDNPCVGTGAQTTFDGQPTFVFEHDHSFYLMLDHWQPQDLRNSGYSILPIKIIGRDLEITWCNHPFESVKDVSV